MAETVARLDSWNKGLQGPEQLFSRAHEELVEQKHWHWSGLSRTGMIEELKKRGQIDDGSASVALALMKIYNTETHASPAWSTMPMEIKGPEQTHEFGDTRDSTDEEVQQLTLACTSFLTGVGQFFRKSGLAIKT